MSKSSLLQQILDNVRSMKTFRKSSTLVPGNNLAILSLVSKALNMNFRAGDVSFTLYNGPDYVTLAVTLNEKPYPPGDANLFGITQSLITFKTN